MKNKKFKVEIESTISYEFEVEAENKEGRNFMNKNGGFSGGCEICQEYMELPKNVLIQACFDLAEETELFVNADYYRESLNQKNKKYLAIELKSLQSRKELLKRKGEVF